MDDELTVKLDVVLGDDLNSFAEQMGFGESLRNGELRCSICGEVVSLANLKLVCPGVDGSVLVVCDNPHCVSEFALGQEGD